MEAAVVHKDSPFPAFIQIEQDIRRQILTGTLQNGDQLVRENVLAEKYGASRVTVRRALKELADAGLVSRIHGVGTFVTAPAKPVPYDLSAMVSFTRQLRAAGYDPEVSMDRREIVDGLPDVMSEASGVKKGPFILLRRLVSVAGQPIGINSSWVPSDICPALAQTELIDGSLWNTLETRFGLKPMNADNRVEAIRASSAEAQLLRCEDNAPLLRLISVVHGPGKQILEYCSVLWTENVRLRFSSLPG